ncbi:conserved hypothetical protein [Leptothrix cholodnii SP-6]|uniref:Transmembrane protein n=1 Tax=Leptothrix cholodnii (strain ATCC 51168 / LMG 8142 / SP-6) TaxID=395495 RepID=B1XXU5_LEPCP|nr:hypothetical protein [Leptothrix cholodnii]ACB36414.1 conserved hypothetical protein [Leptothrix cholodnii SP-6]
MAIAWLTVLKAVPWVDVISNAPKVADGAKKLWGSVARKAPPATADAGHTAGLPAGHKVASLAELEMRLASAESAAADLHQQMLVSSELIQQLAEQNAQLIARIDANRVRVRWLTGVTVALGVVAVTALVMVLGLAG